MIWTIGIDPGLCGALALVDGDCELVDTLDTPTVKVDKGKRLHAEREMYEALRWMIMKAPEERVYIFIERQQMIPGINAFAMFGTGFSFGLWSMAAAASGKPWQSIAPQTWTKIGRASCRERV